MLMAGDEFVHDEAALLMEDDLLTLGEAVRAADAVIEATSTESESDLRWKAVIAVGEHIRDRPVEVWNFIRRWGSDHIEDLRSAIACCLLEHLLEHRFDRFFPRGEELAITDQLFADT